MRPRGGPGQGRLREGIGDPALALSMAGWVFGLAVTVLILGTPYLVFGFRSPSLHLILDSVDACVATLVAYLVHGRFVRRRRLQDLLLSQGLALLALAGLGLSYPVQFLDGARSGTLEVWLPLSVRMIGALLILAAALAGERSVDPARWKKHWPVITPVALVTTLVGVFWVQRSRLPLALDPADFPISTQYPVLSGHVLLLVAQAVAAACFFIASIAFTARAIGSGDQLARWLGPAFALGAFARVNYLLFPSLYTTWLYTGDLLRTGCYLLLLIGATREIRQYWTAQSQIAVLEDRRRLARELHDGVIQELGYIRSESHAIPAGTGSGERIIGACDRALDEARAALHALGSVTDEPLGVALNQAARQVADRYDVHLDFDADSTVHATADQRHALVRITREAISNAARHSGARRVIVRVGSAAEHHQLSIRDDGEGFDVATSLSKSTGYGLVSMRERAHALPGTFILESALGTGSVVKVDW